MSRIHRIEYYLKLAKLTAKRGTCSRLKVGCVLVDPKTNRIASVGYNSSHSGQPHCDDVGCLMDQTNTHCIRCSHAEISAITNLEHKYEELVCYLTHTPCHNCLNALISANTKIVYFIENYPNKDTEIVAKNNNIMLIQIDKLEEDL